VHLAIGIAMLAIFVASGVVLRELRPSHRDELLFRAMARANHIYLLLAGLVNLGLSTDRSATEKPWVRRTRAIATALVGAGSALLVVAFFTEPNASELKRPWTLPGIVSVALGTLVVTIASRRA
jgi:hypothetical protein